MSPEIFSQDSSFYSFSLQLGLERIHGSLYLEFYNLQSLGWPLVRFIAIRSSIDVTRTVRRALYSHGHCLRCYSFVVNDTLDLARYVQITETQGKGGASPKRARRD